MQIQLLKIWDRIRTSFWFVPTLMSLGAMLLSFASVSVDESITDEWLSRQSWAYTGGAESAGTVLGTIAGSMITIAGVVFSLTLVALSLASSQFGPRLLRNFMSDTANQTVLGTFVATFLYCLLVLRTIRRPDEGDFVPHLSITLGVALAIVSIGVLIYYIHHVAVSIQADKVIGRVSAELGEAIDRLFPNEIGEGAAPESDGQSQYERASDGSSKPIAAPADGYLQLIDADALMRIARERNLLIHIERHPGQYLIAGTALLLAWPASGIDCESEQALATAFVIGEQRTPAQDVEFCIHQLVEIALRALSPSMNDPFTAISCIDRLGSALHRLGQREFPSAYRKDSEGKLRVIARPVSFSALLDAAFTQIRQSAATNLAVAIRLIETIAAIAPGMPRPEDREALQRHALMIDSDVRSHRQDRHDLANVAERFHAAMAALRMKHDN
jgi:uncharacterized membrane protein